MSTQRLTGGSTVPDTEVKSYHDFPSYIKHLADRRASVFFDPCHGNNGDDLIIAGAEAVLSGAGIARVDDPDRADAIVINGSGNFLHGYTQGISKVRFYSEKLPAIPLCIGPSSFHLQSKELAGIVARRSAKTVVCVRETPSEQNIRSILAGLDGVEYLRDHDLAFHIPLDHPIFRTPRSDRSVLIVERLDREHHADGAGPAVERQSPARKLANRLLPEIVKKALRRIRKKQKGRRLTPFRQWADRKLAGDFPQHLSLPRVALDISSRDVASFDQFVQTIADSAVVFTNRLHVGILAGRMGKPTFLVEGSYHKCRGIFERSLSAYPNVTLVSPDSIVPSSQRG